MEAYNIMIPRHKTGGAEELYKEMRKTEKSGHRKKRRRTLKNKFTVLLTIRLYGELDTVMSFMRSVMKWTYSKWLK